MVLQMVMSTIGSGVRECATPWFSIGLKKNPVSLLRIFHIFLLEYSKYFVESHDFNLNLEYHTPRSGIHIFCEILFTTI